MTETTCLQQCIRLHQQHIPELAEISLPDADDLESLTRPYEQCYPLLEKAMWSTESEFDALLDSYQSLFREQEVLIQQYHQQHGGDDCRYDFILGITVADRPPHLRACLESIYQLCRQFAYGGTETAADNTKQYRKIRIIVAEDSRETTNIQRHIDIIEEYRQKGLQVMHFGQDEQYQLLQAIPQQLRLHLGNILTTQPKDKFYLKGQAGNRNLGYLKFLQLTGNKDETLYYMVDCDQSFCVNRHTPDGEKIVTALNYFYYIDKQFRSRNLLMLTGKMIGDPPVSPSVMAANFLDDVTGFFTTLSQTDKKQPCRFHTPLTHGIGDAAYHDMASLFGFEQQRSSYPYRCRLDGQHDHIACLADFSRRLNAFFFGEHLTRKTTFNLGNGFDEVTPARTIYPGNYIVNYDGLKYIIPFGGLRLRMSGPTAGRLIAAEIGERFASINLPHLHRRTTEAGLSDDFRPGVTLEDSLERIDLNNEFERQFFGDLMLFTTEALVKQVDASQPFTREAVSTVIHQTEEELLQLYQKKHDAIADKTRRLEKLVFHDGHWWANVPELKTSLAKVQTFLDNIRHNFGQQSQAWKQIQSSSHRSARKQQLIDALINYRTERNAWDQLF